MAFIDDTIFLKITGKQYGIPGTEVKLDPADEQNSGLSKACYASCKDILTRDQAMVGPVIGFLSDAVMQEIESCLKVVMELS
jgi:mRNA-degrading endonuclease toxin of MazEF toxin-antitoxin module